MGKPVDGRKVAIIGCGFVGSATAFTPHAKRIVLGDGACGRGPRARAEGEALDISHGMPFASPMNIYAGDYDDVADAAIIVITAGANQQPGETRIDLVNRNVAIFKSILAEIRARECSGILLVVSNPVDVLTYVSLRLSGLPEHRVIGSGTVLDTGRLKHAIGERLGVEFPQRARAHPGASTATASLSPGRARTWRAFRWKTTSTCARRAPTRSSAPR